jgi:hypothetical protein
MADSKDMWLGDDLNVGTIQDGAMKGIGIGNAFGNAFQRMLNLFARPIVLSTQALFRKDMGERFLDPNQAFLTIVVIIVATGVSFLSGLEGYRDPNNPFARSVPDARTTISLIVGAVWLAGFIAAVAWHFRVTLPKRGRDSILWHSRSNGVPRVPGITLPIELAIVWALSFLAFFAGLFGFGVLLFVSALFTLQSDLYLKTEFYNRVLDAIDSQIESEELGEAIERKLSPAQARGVQAWMPAHISDDYRKKVAKLFKRS